MAEALGIAAAAAQFAGLALKIAKTGKDIYDQLQNVPEQVPKWLEQIDGLQSIVSNIKSCPELQTDNVGLLLKSCVSTSEELLRSLNGLHFSADDPLGQRTWKAVVGKTKETELRNLFEEIERIKSALGLEIDVENLNQQRKIRSEIQELKTSNLTNSDEDQCLRSLFVTDPTRDRDDIIDAKGDICPGTCEWITTTEEFKEWNQQSPHLLWISAPPGTGKTFMSIYLSRHFELLSDEQTDTKVLFFFCDNKNETRNTAVNVLRGLLYQLIMHQRNLLDIVLPQWKIQSANLFQGHSLNTLWKFFEEMVNKVHAKTVYCIVDALDECEASSLSSLLRKFEILGKSARPYPAKMKLICLSRRYPEDIPAALSSFLALKLDVMTAGKEDTRRFISQRVAELATKKRIDANLQAHIEQTFQEKSEGTFLWISFMAQDLEKKSIDRIEASLQLLPQGLNAVYERIISQIKPDEMQSVSRMIDWIRIAARPLRVPELCEAIDLQPTGLLSREQVCKSLIESCGHLLQITPNTTTIWYETRQAASFEPDPMENHHRDSPNYWQLEVTFLHQSAKDYFTRSSQMRGSKLQVEPTKQLHEIVSGQLTTYLSDREADAQQWNEKDVVMVSPLSYYACRFWDFHFKELDEVSQLIERNRAFFEKSSRMRDEVVYSHSYNDWDISSIPLLHMACILDLSNLAKWCLERRRVRNRFGLMSDLTKKWGKREFTPLHLAYRYKHEDIAKLLLDAGADPRAVDGYGATAFEVALRNCGQDAWHQLAATKRGKKWLDPRNQDFSALDTAAFGGNEDACRFLIEEHGWDVNHRNPLVTALQRARLALARTFVSEWHACIDNHSALLNAVCKINDDHDFQEGIKILVEEWSVDINTTNKLGCTLLCVISRPVTYPSRPAKYHSRPAKCHSLESTASNLGTAIRAGADPSKPNSKGKMPLHCAAASTCFPAFILRTEAIELMSHNSQSLLDVVCDEGRTILHHFVSKLRSIKLGRYRNRDEAEDFDRYLNDVPVSTKRLLDLGADRHKRDKGGKSAIDLLRPALSRDQRSTRFCDEQSAKYRLVVEETVTILECYASAPICPINSVGGTGENGGMRANSA
ncbi:hypothetical protein EDB81DRAFT_949989 [Dactylonectria macrodidyma]|uniref:Nephrocystin 3-like N-terminal domain-containing protein n=1 Tax=Dactylonectria macrodidyma TaxID=307937 RepID=A0A9P9IVC7_9HYPO|nr:hypothetical protein EDB81DRAFT_949989 [Dactylonectria macrodidyma]